MRRQYTLQIFNYFKNFETSVTGIEPNPSRFNITDTENSLPSHFKTESLKEKHDYVKLCRFFFNFQTFSRHIGSVILDFSDTTLGL